MSSGVYYLLKNSKRIYFHPSSAVPPFKLTSFRPKELDGLKFLNAYLLGIGIRHTHTVGDVGFRTITYPFGKRDRVLKCDS